MKSSLFSALFSPRFIKIWLSTLIAILIVNFTVITYRHDIYTRYRRTKWNPPVEKSTFIPQTSRPPSPTSPTTIDLLKALYAPKIHPIDWPNYIDHEGVEHQMNNTPVWTESLGERLCIVDIDTRALNGSGQILSKEGFRWDDVEYTGAGMLNHYLYAKIHGYTYHAIHTTPLPDRSAFWTKIPALAHTLSPERCDITVSIDADATFQNLNLPLEWLFNRWSFSKQTSLLLPLDPNQPNNRDLAHNHINLNCGFVIAQNLPRTHDILKAWESCPDNNFGFPGCEKWKMEWPAEQAAMGEYIRYAFNRTEDIRAIPCDEANGFPGNPFGECNGVFVRHYWSDKDLVKGNVEGEVLRMVMGAVHGEFVRDGEVVVDDGGKRMRGDVGRVLNGKLAHEVEIVEAVTGERFAGDEFDRESFGKRS